MQFFNSMIRFTSLAYIDPNHLINYFCYVVGFLSRYSSIDCRSNYFCSNWFATSHITSSLLMYNTTARFGECYNLDLINAIRVNVEALRASASSYILTKYENN